MIKQFGMWLQRRAVRKACIKLIKAFPEIEKCAFRFCPDNTGWELHYYPSM